MTVSRICIIRNQRVSVTNLWVVTFNQHNYSTKCQPVLHGFLCWLGPSDFYNQWDELRSWIIFNHFHQTIINFFIATYLFIMQRTTGFLISTHCRQFYVTWICNNKIKSLEERSLSSKFGKRTKRVNLTFTHTTTMLLACTNFARRYKKNSAPKLNPGDLF
jgi:hypothetical protein